MNLEKFEEDYLRLSRTEPPKNALKLAFILAVEEENEVARKLREEAEIQRNLEAAELIQNAWKYLRKAFEGSSFLLKAFEPTIKAVTDFKYVEFIFALEDFSVRGRYGPDSAEINGCTCETPEEFYRELMDAVKYKVRDAHNLKAKRYGQ